MSHPKLKHQQAAIAMTEAVKQKISKFEGDLRQLGELVKGATLEPQTLEYFKRCIVETEDAIAELRAIQAYYHQLSWKLFHSRKATP
jgi:hypothetical protein